MLQSEFEKLIGHEVSADDYASIEPIYNNCALSKQDFCLLYREVEKAVRNSVRQYKDIYYDSKRL